MCSSRPASSPRIWSLRLRLLVGQVVVLAVVCVGITAATEMALRRHLVAQLDNQLGGTSYRSVLMYPEKMPRPPWRRETHNYIRSGPGPRFLDAPGQPAGMVAAVVSDGTTVAAGYLTGSGSRAALTSTGRSQLERIAGSRTPLTLDLDGLGRYRVLAAPSRNGHDVIVTGLSMGNVDATMLQMLIIFGIVTVIALVAATTAGIVIIKRALAPLRRVAQTASEVVDLPLDRGEVKLPVRVPEPDANPSTEVGQLGSALNRMLDHIAAALSARQASETRVRQFVADASHELRTPLAAIRGYTELTQRIGDDPEAVAHAMSRVASETERITRLVEDLLLLARLDSGRPLERGPVDMSRLAVDAVSDAHVAGPDHQWALDLPPNRWSSRVMRHGCTRW
ncbi:two component sensor kinase TcrY [Mycobacterium tuberculosis variant africanum]|nr:two component sensor kinase TcrY [Mycobacterium tuberculosis variant africanum]